MLYSVSLVLVKTENNQTNTCLRTYIMEAVNAEEALGAGLVEVNKDRTLKNYLIMTFNAYKCELGTAEEKK